MTGKRERQHDGVVETAAIGPEDGLAAQTDTPACSSEEQVGNTLRNTSLYRLRKRVPERPANHKNDIYVSGRSVVVVLQKRVRHMFEDRHCHEVRMHGTGAAIEKTILAALMISSGQDSGLDISVTTASATVYDDYEPLKPGHPFVTKERFVSVVHVTLRRDHATQVTLL